MPRPNRRVEHEMKQDGEFGAIWDLDGTLVDTERNHFKAWRRLLREEGRELSYEEFRPTFGLRNDDVLTKYFGFDRADYDIELLGERKEEYFLSSLVGEGVTLQAGAVELVSHFTDLGVKQAIASSAPPGNISVIMSLLPINEAFAAVISSEGLPHGKPAPDIMLKAAAELGVSPASAIVLEDAPAGVQAGKSAGCKVIAIEAAFPRETLASADLVVTSFGEVLWPESRWRDFLGVDQTPTM